MLISYLVDNRLNTTGKVDTDAAYLIDRLQDYIYGQIDPEKGQTSKPLVSFLPGSQFQCPKTIRKP